MFHSQAPMRATLESGLQTPLAGLVQLPGLIAVMYVDRDANCTGDSAIIIDDRPQMQGMPAIFAVGPADADIDLLGAGAGDQLAPRGDDAGNVLVRDETFPVAASQFILRLAQIARRPSVDVEQTPSGSGMPHKRGQKIRRIVSTHAAPDKEVMWR
jgi:hypothetical protein